MNTILRRCKCADESYRMSPKIVTEISLEFMFSNNMSTINLKRRMEVGKHLKISKNTKMYKQFQYYLEGFHFFHRDISHILTHSTLITTMEGIRDSLAHVVASRHLKSVTSLRSHSYRLGNWKNQR